MTEQEYMSESRMRIDHIPYLFWWEWIGIREKLRKHGVVGQCCMMTLNRRRGTEGVIGKKRSHMEIVAEILEQVQTPTNKTRIMRQCNLSYEKIKTCLSFMRLNGLVERKEKTETTLYKRTQKGWRFLKHYRAMIRLLMKRVPPLSIYQVRRR